MNKTLNNVIINVDFEEPEEFEGLQTGARLGQLMGQTAAGLKKAIESYESLTKAIEEINEDIGQLSGVDVPYTVDGETDEDKVVTFEYPTTFGLLNANAVKVGSLAVYPSSIYSESGFRALNSVTNGFYIASGDKYKDIRYSIVIGAGHNSSASVAPSVDQSLVLGGGVSIGNQIYYSLVNGSGSMVSDGVRYSILGGNHFEAKSLDAVLAIPNVGMFSGKAIKNSIIYGGFHRYVGDAEELNNMLIGGVNSDLSIITADKGYSIIIGNGTSSELKNILTLDNDGNLTISGKITASNGFGENNTIVNNYNTIISGNTNDVANGSDSIVFGKENTINGYIHQSIFGGYGNSTKDNVYCSAVVGSGIDNCNFSYSFAAGTLKNMYVSSSFITNSVSNSSDYTLSAYHIISTATIGSTLTQDSSIDDSLLLGGLFLTNPDISRSIIVGDGRIDNTEQNITDSLVFINGNDEIYIKPKIDGSIVSIQPSLNDLADTIYQDSLIVGSDINGDYNKTVVSGFDINIKAYNSLVCGFGHNYSDNVVFDSLILGGRYADIKTMDRLVIGNGSIDKQSNALELDYYGNLTISGALNLYDASGNKYALTVENGNLKLTLAQ